MTRTDIHDRFCEHFAAEGASPIPVEQLVAIESVIGTKLPQSYLEFATRIGTIYTPQLLDLMTGGESEIAPEGARMDIQNFLSPQEIVEATKSYWSAGMDDWLVAIASDCMGNVFGFRKTIDDQRPDDAPVYVFDHDFCKTTEEEAGFDIWLRSFIRIKEQ
jgi:hypothetical protein